jgi:hypothetical protein
MAPPFLFLRNMSGGSAAVFRYDGATPTQIGNTFGTLETTANPATYMGKNRVIQFQNDLYAVHNLGVYKLQGDGVTWSNTVPNGGFPFTSPGTGGAILYRTGLYPISINGASHLICAFSNTTAGHLFVTMDAATNTWSETPVKFTANPYLSSGGYLTEIVYQNKFYLLFRNNTGLVNLTYEYDPVTGTVANLPNGGLFTGGANANSSDICIHNGRLFMSHINTGGGTTNLAEFSGGQWVDKGRATNTVVTTGSDLVETRVSLMSDGTNLYYIALYTSGNFGFFVSQISDPDALPGASSFIQTTVLPSALRNTTDGGTGFANDDARLIHVPDTQTNPGTPDHYFYFAISATAGTSQQLYQWNGNSSVMTAVGPSGGDVAHSIPTASAAGGERIFSAVVTDNDILITKRETVSGGIKITFRAYSPSGSTSGTVRIWITLQGEPVSTQASLTTPVTGGSASLSGNTVITVVANGTTDYTVVIPAVANSFTNLDQVDLVPEFF